MGERETQQAPMGKPSRRRSPYFEIAFTGAFFISTVAAQADDMARPPRGGLKSNHNYYLYNDGKPIHGLVVEIEITKDLVCDDIGFHVQLNANSPVGTTSTGWQQYVMGYQPAFKFNDRPGVPAVGSSIEYFNLQHAFDTGKKKPPNTDPLRHLPNAWTLPAGARFIIKLKYEGDIVIGADFTYVQKDGQDKHGWMIPVPPPSPPYPNPGIPSSVRVAIVAFQVDIVGSSGGNTAMMKSGEGIIRYSADEAMTVMGKRPPSVGATTAEKANSVYGKLPIGPSKTFTQTFAVDQTASK